MVGEDVGADDPVLTSGRVLEELLQGELGVANGGSLEERGGERRGTLT